MILQGHDAACLDGAGDGAACLLSDAASEESGHGEQVAREGRDPERTSDARSPSCMSLCSVELLTSLDARRCLSIVGVVETILGCRWQRFSARTSAASVRVDRAHAMTSPTVRGAQASRCMWGTAERVRVLPAQWLVHAG